MLRCGLLGKKLGHSYSPEIHALLSGYEYDLFEKSEDELESFIKGDFWDGLNVTIPYKKTVLKYCDELSDLARITGSVNTLVRRKDGTIFGDTTDVYGFLSCVRSSGIETCGRKTLVLGSGGASTAICAALSELGAKPVIISRSGENNYSNLFLHKDAEIIVNTTPVGMYPNNGESPLDLELFPECKGVFDIIYNPARTALLLQAEKLGIPYKNGLHMLVAQAKRTSELFTGSDIPDDKIETITDRLSKTTENVVLIGMPGSGKTTVAEMLAEKTNRTVLDSDAYVEEKSGMSIPEIFKKYGETYFRDLESEAISELGKHSGAVISTGGGSVLREENYAPMHQNGRIIWIRKDVDGLPRDGRPLSVGDLNEMYAKREPLYRRFSDYVIDNDGTPEETVSRIMEVLK